MLLSAREARYLSRTCGGVRGRDLAAMLGVCVRTIERIDLEGRGPAQTRIGKGVRYHPRDVERWLEERRQRRRA